MNQVYITKQSEQIDAILKAQANTFGKSVAAMLMK